MPSPWQRDLEADGKKFEAWLCGKLPGATNLRMSPLVAPQSSGFSNETLLFDLEWQEAGESCSESLVVRIQPIGSRRHFHQAGQRGTDGTAPSCRAMRSCLYRRRSCKTM